MSLTDVVVEEKRFIRLAAVFADEFQVIKTLQSELCGLGEPMRKVQRIGWRIKECALIEVSCPDSSFRLEDSSIRLECLE